MGCFAPNVTTAGIGSLVILEASGPPTLLKDAEGSQGGVEEFITFYKSPYYNCNGKWQSIFILYSNEAFILRGSDFIEEESPTSSAGRHINDS